MTCVLTARRYTIKGNSGLVLAMQLPAHFISTGESKTCPTNVNTFPELQLIRADELKVAGCGFVVDYLRKHPEYGNLVG